MLLKVSSVYLGGVEGALDQELEDVDLVPSFTSTTILGILEPHCPPAYLSGLLRGSHETMYVHAFENSNVSSYYFLSRV